jgi:hypothetical protein
MTDAEQKPMRIEVSRRIAASPGEVFAVLRDPRGHVDIDASGMLIAWTIEGRLRRLGASSGQAPQSAQTSGITSVFNGANRRVNR